MLNDMNLKILVVAIAAVDTMGMLTTLSFVQEAEAYACNLNYKKGDFDCSQGQCRFK
jgi:hypothetical protein